MEGLTLPKVIAGAVSGAMTLVIGAWVIVAFVVGGTNDRVSSLDESVKFLTEATTDNKASLARQAAAVEGLAASVGRLTTTVDSLEGTLAKMNGTVEALNASFTVADRRDQDFQRMMMTVILRQGWLPDSDLK